MDNRDEVRAAPAACMEGCNGIYAVIDVAMVNATGEEFPVRIGDSHSPHTLTYLTLISFLDASFVVFLPSFQTHDAHLNSNPPSRADSHSPHTLSSLKGWPRASTAKATL